MSMAPGPSSGADIPDEWYFITAPQEVSYRKESKAEEISTYGTNNPYLSYGATKLRQLSLKNAMLEGFSDAKEVEGNLTNIQKCMLMVIDEGSGFTAPYCWHVFAGDKSYGTYIIKSVNVAERMRDMTGKATRAFVDIEFQEVPSYQVTSGMDIATTAVTGSIPEKFARDTLKAQEAGGAAGAQDAAVAAANGGGESETGTKPEATAIDPGQVKPIFGPPAPKNYGPSKYDFDLGVRGETFIPNRVGS